MDWTPAAGIDSQALQRAYRASTGPFFPLMAPLEGPDLMRVQYTLRPPYPFQTVVPGAPAYSASAPPDSGLVRLRLRETSTRCGSPISERDLHGRDHEEAREHRGQVGVVRRGRHVQRPRSDQEQAGHAGGEPAGIG